VTDNNKKKKKQKTLNFEIQTEDHKPKLITCAYVCLFFSKLRTSTSRELQYGSKKLATRLMVSAARGWSDPILGVGNGSPSKALAHIIIESEIDFKL
jgi:hypothetical protein